ncbi:MAG: SRPBCC family protein [Bacteroidia bacterium]
MKSIFETEINMSQAKLAELYANPENNIKWMLDLEKYEPISGMPGMPGSKYRLIPKKGNMIFTATVISRDLPNELKLNLEASNVNVLVTGKFIALSPEKTKFISEEVFTFKGIFNKIFGFLAQSLVKKTHNKHMKDFKEFAKSIK